MCEASSAEEALDLLAYCARIDIVFSDYQLSGALDGWELYEIVRRDYPKLPFILTSAQMPPADAKDRFVPFIAKPYQPAIIATLITRTIDGRTRAGGQE